MGLRDDIAHARCRFTSYKCYAFATAATRDSNSGAVRSAVASGRRGVRNRASVLVPDSPCRLAADRYSSTRRSSQHRAVYCRVTQSGCRPTHLPRYLPIKMKLNFRAPHNQISIDLHQTTLYGIDAARFDVDRNRLFFDRCASLDRDAHSTDLNLAAGLHHDL